MKTTTPLDTLLQALTDLQQAIEDCPPHQCVPRDAGIPDHLSRGLQLEALLQQGDLIDRMQHGERLGLAGIITDLAKLNLDPAARAAVMDTAADSLHGVLTTDVEVGIHALNERSAPAASLAHSLIAAELLAILDRILPERRTRQ